MMKSDDHLKLVDDEFIKEFAIKYGKLVVKEDTYFKELIKDERARIAKRCLNYFMDHRHQECEEYLKKIIKKR